MFALLSPRRRRGLCLATMALGAISVAGCGRRGDLEPPSANAMQTAGKKQDLEMRRPSRTIAAPKGDFMLDPLLK